MTDLETLTGNKHLSYSGLDSLLTCSERFRLEKVLSVPRGTAWYLLGGSAVHSATEYLDKEETDSPREAWDRAWAEQLATIEGQDHTTIRAGGRASDKWPNKENKDWWEDNGLKQVEGWAAWSAARKAEGWTLWGIEVPFQITLGDTPVRGFIDRVWVTPTGELEVHDLKTGSRQPPSAVQLGVYRQGLRKEHGIDPIIGRYHMTRQGMKPSYEAAQRDLTIYTEDMLGSWYDRARAIIEAGLFIPHIGPFCTSCTVAPYCSAVGGTPPALDRK